MASERASADWTEALTFVGRFVRHPGTVGSLVPSTPRLAAAMTAPVATASRPRASAGEPRTIVEIGAGTGAFTKAIVELVGPTDRFLAVEIDPVFAGHLARRWPAIDVAQASAESLTTLLADRGWTGADHVVSGVPFATLPPATTERIVEAIATILRPGGTFTTFHYAHSVAVPRARHFRVCVSASLRVRPSMVFVARNFPPAFAVTWRT